MLSPWCNCPEIDNVSSRSDSRCSLPMLTAQVTRPVDTASDAARTLSSLLASLRQRKSQKEEMPTDGMGSRAEAADAATLLMQIQADASASDALGF